MDDGDSLLLRITTAAIRKPEPGPSPVYGKLNMDDGDSLLLRITTAAIRKPEPGPSPKFSSREGENQEGPKT